MGALPDGERRSTLVYWPSSVDERLDLLLSLIASKGGHASRAQVLAALVVAAPLDGDELERRLRDYRLRDEELFTAEHSRLPPPRGSRHRPGPRVGRKTEGREDPP